METKPPEGAVCYIDLLGFSYLTNLLENNKKYNDNKKEKKFGDKCVKELKLSDLPRLENYIKFGEPEDLSNISIADWAYEIVDTNLKKFHEIVEKSCSDFQEAEYIVISDSLFIVSKNADDILYILANIFRQCIKNGILLRAGLAYGIYYSVKTHISSFNIYGPAVTKAVCYEKLGKGCRIFTDSKFSKHSEISNSEIISEYKNFMNYSRIDCFEWLMIKDKYAFDEHDIRLFSKSDRFTAALDLLCDNIEVLYTLRWSQKYEWNLKSEAGIEQLAASLEYISALVDKIRNPSNSDELKESSEKINNGKVVVKQQRLSEEILISMICSKKAELKEEFNGIRQL